MVGGMAVIVDAPGNLFEPVSFDREDGFEKCAVALADRIFGQCHRLCLWVISSPT